MKSEIGYKILNESDLGAIIEVEKKAFVPELQASEEIIRKRLQMNHIYVGAIKNKKVVGTLGFRYAFFNQNDKDNFPSTCRDFANKPYESGANAMFVYTLGIIPTDRKLNLVLGLIQYSFDVARSQGAELMAAEGRIPSYNGSLKENIKYKAEVKLVVDDALKSKVDFPALDKLLKDPLLGFYRRYVKVDFLWLIPNFTPEDTASGGHRVIFYKELK